MARKAKTKASSNLFARAGDAGGARLDVLLPREWPQTETALLWHYRSSGGDVQSGRGSIDELPSVGSTPVRVWTPATETLLTRTALPTRSRKLIDQALPGKLEEQLLDDPEKLHFAWRREDDGTVYVAVTAKERLRSWTSALTHAGIKPVALCPATLAVPWSPDSWSAAFVGDELIVRTGPVSGFTCVASEDEPPALLTTNVQQLQQGTRPPEYFIAFQPPAAFRADAWSSALGLPVRVEPQPFWNVPGDSEPALNLLQGDFATKGEASKQLRPWIPAGVMLAAWLVGTIAFDGIEWFRLHRAHNQNQQEMTELLMSAFPDTKTILDPAQQMQRGLEALQGRAGMRAQDMLPLLTRMTRAWQSGGRARLRGIRYGQKSLTIEITAADNSAIEDFRRAMQSQGLQAELLGSTTKGNEVEGSVRLQAPAASTGTKS